MVLRGLDVTPIDDLHHMAAAHWTADYETGSRRPLSIDFDVTYLLQTRDGRSKIFAFIAGDEMTLLRQHGLDRRIAASASGRFSSGRPRRASGLLARGHDGGRHDPDGHNALPDDLRAGVR